MIRGSPVDSGDHPRPTTRAAAVEHSNRGEVGLGCQAVGGAGHRAGHVGSVAVAVVGAVAVADRAVAGGDPAAELRVIGADAGVDDVGGHAVAVRAGADAVVHREGALICAVEPPRGGRAVARAEAQCLYRLIALDHQYSGVVVQPGDISRRELGDDPLERDAKGIGYIVSARLLQLDLVGDVGPALVDDDVGVIGAGGAGACDGRAAESHCRQRHGPSNHSHPTPARA